ncbi:MAG: tldD, partial [Rhodocyclales bacterium]|nr:tldD [Rhodocyclales bacterium]
MNAITSPPLKALNTARELLLLPGGLNEAVLSKVLGSIMSHQVDYADLYFQYQRSEGWSLEEGIVKSGSFSIEQGVGVRAVAGEKTAFAYSDDVSLKALTETANTTRAIAAAGSARKVKVAAAKNNPLALYADLDPIAALPATEKVRMLERLESFARAEDPRIIQVMAYLAATWEVVLVARSDGHLAADVRPLVRISLSVVMEENGRREQGSSGGGARMNFSYFDDDMLREYARQAVHQARVNLGARSAPAGTMTVVLGNGWPGILLHEAIGHGLEGDFNRKGSSAFAGMMGKQVAAKGVTVVDDGTLKDRRGSLTIDDEGNPTRRTTLIEDGILVGYMQDMMNARLMGVAPTGNGRRESFAHLPMPRMTNTLMVAGNTPPEEIIASVKNGLYAVNFGGGQVDITSGKFVFSAAEAYVIENGKIGQAVKGATLIGNGPDALTKVT